MLRVLTLSTLFPDVTRPTFGVFVERQTLELAAHPDVELKVVSPLGIPPWPVSALPRYRPFGQIPERENWKSLDILRPRFNHWPGTKGRFDAASLARSLLPTLLALRDEFAFDVIDAQFFFPDGVAAAKLGDMLNVPVSIKARGSDISFWGTVGPTAPQVIEAGQRADGSLAVSAALKAEMVSLGIPDERIRVHYTGVDLDRFELRDRQVAKAGLGVEGPLLVTIGALVPVKGHALVIDALRHLPDASLVIIGKGELHDALKAQAREAGVADRVRFTGPINHAAISNWLSAADVMVLPSEREGLANAWLEALASGTPVVIPDVGGAREVVIGPEAGRLVARDPQAIAAAVTDLLANPPERAAVRKYAERFTWQANRDALFEHLSGLVSGRENPRQG